ncbi:hypothetical protein Bbelb_065750 [Branchiostoma belcheri]|nr:hypothetical protein Bbelb_065750 [Branchiostoma belcheri]
MYEQAEPVRTPPAGSGREHNNRPRAPYPDPPARRGNASGHVDPGEQACHMNQEEEDTSSNVYEEAEAVKLENISGDVPHGTDTSTDTEVTPQGKAKSRRVCYMAAVLGTLVIVCAIVLMSINYGTYKHGKEKPNIPTAVDTMNLGHKENQTGTIEHLKEKTNMIAARCPPLSHPNNGFMGGHNSYGDVVNFTCEPGYKLVGASSLTCLPDGTWDGPSPTCTAAQCPPLTNPIKGFVTDSNPYGDMANFTCEPGYKLVGTSSLTCLSDGTWNGTSPTCTAVQCPPLSHPNNGFMGGNNSYGDVVNFTCEPGYKLVGTSSLTCLSDGTWDGTSPTCTGDAVQCSPMSHPTNGFVTGSNSYRDVANFTCEPGYKLVGTSSLTCLSNGTWNGTSPTCTGKGPRLRHTRLKFLPLLDGTREEQEPIIVVLTRDGLQLKSVVGAAGVLSRRDNSRRVRHRNDIVAVQCPLLSNPLNGFVSGSNSYGDVVNFTCEPGYSLISKSSLTCLSDGIWDGNPATCTAVKCHPLSNPFNGFVTGSNSYGDVVKFTCEPGYKLVGTSSLTCLSDGTWDGKLPTCTAVQCPLVSPPTNGFVTGSNSYGDVVSFTCEPGYKLVGPSSLTCLSDGTWNGKSPTCTAVQCPLLSPPTNGILTGTNSYGDVANFTCEPGYKLVGTSSLTCLSDGTWDGTSPTCAAVQCSPLLNPINGLMSGSNSYGDVVNFTCEPGYKLVGTSSLTCLSDGTWDGTSPTCKAVQCPTLSQPPNGFMTGFNSYGDVVYFTCDQGYRLVGKSSLTCLSDGTWSDLSPTCAVKGFTVWAQSFAIEDPSYRHDNFKKTYIKINGQESRIGKRIHPLPDFPNINRPGTLGNKPYRGHFVFILNERTGAVLEKATFDTFWGGGGTAAARSLTTYLQEVKEGRIMVIAVEDSGYTGVNNKPNLAPYGSNIQLGHRESWAMITQKGMIPTWFVEKKSAKGAGPTVVQAYIQVDDEGEPAGAWLAQDPSWFVMSVGKPHVKDGVTYDATKVLDGDTKTYWNVYGTCRNYNNWFIILDLKSPHNLIRIAVNNYGDTTHDIAAFKLQTSQGRGLWNWKDIVTITDVLAGTRQRQEFGGFQETGRYWRFVITRTHSGYQPYLTELNLYGMTAAGGCKAGYRLVSRTCIRLSAGTKSYDDARKACIDDGGTLAMPKTRKLDVALRNLVKATGQNQDYWVGMKDVRSRVVDARRWEWEDGSDLGNYLVSYTLSSRFR